MLDRVWWIWQMQDPENRVHLVPGLGAQQMNHPMMLAGLAERQTGLEYLEKRQANRGKTAKDYVVDLGWTAPMVTLDKLNDNLLFSCCCARVDWSWSTVCGCYRGHNQCDQGCLEQALVDDSLFYTVGTNLYNNLTYMYPDANIWRASCLFQAIGAL